MGIRVTNNLIDYEIYITTIDYSLNVIVMFFNNNNSNILHKINSKHAQNNIIS